VGLNFNDCNKFILSFNFENCQLNFSVFHRLVLKNMEFKNCNLSEADFTKTDLTNSTFYDCDLAGTIFQNSMLEKVDFTTSYNYTIDPEINKLKKTRFAITGIAGLLSKYDIIIK